MNTNLICYICCEGLSTMLKLSSSKTFFHINKNRGMLFKKVFYFPLLCVMLKLRHDTFHLHGYTQGLSNNSVNFQPIFTQIYVYGRLLCVTVCLSSSVMVNSVLVCNVTINKSNNLCIVSIIHDIRNCAGKRKCSSRVQ